VRLELQPGLSRDYDVQALVVSVLISGFLTPLPSKWNQRLCRLGPAMTRGSSWQRGPRSTSCNRRIAPHAPPHTVTPYKLWAQIVYYERGIKSVGKSLGGRLRINTWLIQYFVHADYILKSRERSIYEASLGYLVRLTD